MEGVKESILNGVQFLIKCYNDEIIWEDVSSVGTGHRGILYMQYPVYAKVFPLIALSRFKNKFPNER